MQLPEGLGPEALALASTAKMRCGGCGSKVGATTLGRVLARLQGDGGQQQPQQQVGVRVRVKGALSGQEHWVQHAPRPEQGASAQFPRCPPSASVLWADSYCSQQTKNGAALPVPYPVEQQHSGGNGRSGRS